MAYGSILIKTQKLHCEKRFICGDDGERMKKLNYQEYSFSIPLGWAFKTKTYDIRF